MPIPYFNLKDKDNFKISLSHRVDKVYFERLNVFFNLKKVISSYSKLLTNSSINSLFISLHLIHMKLEKNNKTINLHRKYYTNSKFFKRRYEN